MKYSELLELLEAGAFKHTLDSKGNIKLAGVDVTPKQLDGVLTHLGWEGWVEDPSTILKKTSSILSRFQANLEYDTFKNCGITFKNTRKSDTEKNVTRIYLHISPTEKVMILSGGGKEQRYSLYTSANNFQFPVSSFSSLKSVCDYINDSYESDD